MKRVIFHRRLRLPEGNYLVPTTKCQNLTVRPQLIRTEVQRNLFPILVIHYVAWNSGDSGTCQQMSASENAPNHWKALVTGRPEPARLQRLASALAFSTPSGIQMPSGLWPECPGRSWQLRGWPTCCCYRCNRCDRQVSVLTQFSRFVFWVWRLGGAGNGVGRAWNIPKHAETMSWRLQGMVLSVKCVLAYFGAPDAVSHVTVMWCHDVLTLWPGLISKMLRSVSKLQLSWCPRCLSQLLEAEYGRTLCFS